VRGSIGFGGGFGVGTRVANDPANERWINIAHKRSLEGTGSHASRLHGEMIGALS
jgi:hypothetical protein